MRRSLNPDWGVCRGNVVNIVRCCTIGYSPIIQLEPVLCTIDATHETVVVNIFIRMETDTIQDAGQDGKNDQSKLPSGLLDPGKCDTSHQKYRWQDKQYLAKIIIEGKSKEGKNHHG